MGANRNCRLLRASRHRSLTDGGMGANRNRGAPLYDVDGSLTDGGMGANRNDVQKMVATMLA